MLSSGARIVLRRSQSLESYESAQWKSRVERVWYSMAERQHKVLVKRRPRTAEQSRGEVPSKFIDLLSSGLMSSLVGVKGGATKNTLSVERFVKLSFKPENLLKRREKPSMLDILNDHEYNEVEFGIYRPSLDCDAWSRCVHIYQAASAMSAATKVTDMQTLLQHVSKTLPWGPMLPNVMYHSSSGSVSY